MSLYFEIANLSFEIVMDPQISDVWKLITADVRHYFSGTKTAMNRVIRTNVHFVDDYAPLSGDIVLQDPYRIVLRNLGKEKRVYFFNPFSDVYGVYEELETFESCAMSRETNSTSKDSPNCLQNRESGYLAEIAIETTRQIIDMRFIELLAIEKYLLKENAFILHSCFLDYEGHGIAFTAPSGTGKSTQGRLWEEYGNGQIINGDRAVLQLKDGKWQIHSLPFCGSSDTNRNISLPLEAVTIVNRDLKNHCDVVEYERDLTRIMNEVTVNRWDYDSVSRVLFLVKDLFRQGKVMNLFCTMEPSACYCLKEYLFHD